KLEQLTINYANLTTTLLAQPQERRSHPPMNQGRPRNNNFNAPRPSGANFKYYNCSQPGHMARHCPYPDQRYNCQPRSTNVLRTPRYETRDVNYLDDFEYDEEYEEEYEEDDGEEYEVYLNTRSGPYPQSPVSKNKRAQRSESRREENLRKTPQI